MQEARPASRRRRSRRRTSRRSSPSAKSASSAITKPRSGCVAAPRRRATASSSARRSAVDLARPQDLRAVAGLLEPVHRLAHLPDRAAPRARTRRCRRSPRRRGRARAARAPRRAAGSASDAPRIATRQSRACATLDEAADQLVESARAARSGRPTRSRRRRRRGRRGTRDSSLAEEVRLVGAKHERRQRVDAPGCDERARKLRARAPPARRGSATVRASRRRPRRSTPTPSEQQRQREPVAERAGEVLRAADIDARGAPSSVSRRTKRSVNGWSAAMRFSQSAATAYAAIAAGHGRSAARRRGCRVAASPGPSKSCRRATSSASTTAEASVPWLRPCSTCRAVERPATASRPARPDAAAAPGPARRRAARPPRTRRARGPAARPRRASASAASRVAAAAACAWMRFSSAPHATTAATNDGARAFDASVSRECRRTRRRRRAAAGRRLRRAAMSSACAQRDLAHDGDASPSWR